MSEEIRNKIKEINNELNVSLDPSQFVLNPRIGELLQELENLQRQCEHHFIDGVCEFCGMAEEEG